MATVQGYDLYVRLYCRAANINPTRLFKALEKTDGRSRFNSRLSIIKDRNEWRDEDVAGLVYFVFTHNPLRRSELRQYGYLDAITGSTASYVGWKAVNLDLIQEHGILSAIARTIPKNSDRSCVLSDEDLSLTYGARPKSTRR